MNDLHEYCKDCPGPKYFDQEHKHMYSKISQICVWREAHEQDHIRYREKREMEEKSYRKEVQDNFKGVDDKFTKQQWWLIGILSSGITILFVQIVILLRQ